MRLGGKLALPFVLTGLVLSGCQSSSEPDQAAPRPSSTSTPQAPEETPEPTPSPDAAPAPATSNDIAVPAPVKTSDGLVAELESTKTANFALLGVTWDRNDDDQDVTAEVRVRTADGWSEWEALEIDDGDGEAGRGGTEPWWVEDADEVAARVTTASGASPTGVKVVTVDPGESGTPSTEVSNAFFSSGSGSQAITVAGSTPSYTPKPTMIARSTWKAKAQTQSNSCDDPPDYPRYGQATRGIVLHHSAGSNSYSKSQSASIVRGIQTFHMSGRDWCDIAYNFLVDKYGQIFEGRAGGVDHPVRGSHSGNSPVNEQTMGVALMGNLDKTQPTSAMKNSTVRLIGWRVGTNYMNPRGSYTLGGETLARLSGHRNVVSTACPGKYGYAWLNAKGGLRDRVASYVSDYASLAKSRYLQLGAATTGPVFVGEYPTAGGRKVRLANMDILAKAGLGAFPVGSLSRTEYNRVGAQSGELGFPSTSRQATAVSGVDVQRFEGGSIFGSDATGTPKAFALWGPIAQAYADNGEASGVLGKPKGIIFTNGDGDKQATFQNGYITHSAGSGAVVHVP